LHEDLRFCEMAFPLWSFSKSLGLHLLFASVQLPGMYHIRAVGAG
jgi:hypothetical protein